MVYNINNGKNPHIRQACEWLDEYMIFVNKVREFHCGRTEDLKRSASDKEYQIQLLKEYGLV